jgi:DNA primase
MKELFTQIKNEVDIVDVIGHYITLFPAGNYYKGLSPFKSEKTASFTVTPDKKIFYCFSTHIGGDVIDFVSRMENCSQYQAALLLIQRYNLTINNNLLQASLPKSEKKDNYFKIYALFVSWCESQLQENLVARNYLIERGITFYWQQRYNIGYCPSSDMVYDFLKATQKDSLLLEEVISTNIVQKKGRKLFFSCQERIVFPISNTMQLYCAYGARIISTHNTISVAKYINSVACVEFVKKNMLYGLAQARQKMREQKEVYIVEGYMDTVLMAQAGYENTVATMGTAMTKQHIDYIKKIVDSVVVIYDGDSAGQQALLKSVGFFWNESIDVFVVILPVGEDPASLAQKGMIANFIQNKVSIINYFIDEKKRALEDDSLRNKYEVLTDIIKMIETIEDETKKFSIIMKVAKVLEITYESLENIMKKTKSKSNIIQADTKKLNVESSKEIITVDVQEKNLWYLFFYLTFYFYDSDAGMTAKSIFLINNFSDEKFKIILNEYVMQYNCDNNKKFLDFFKEYNEKLYLHCIKIMSMYQFTPIQYSIIYKKIIAISWKKYKKNNEVLSFNDFIKEIEN